MRHECNECASGCRSYKGIKTMTILLELPAHSQQNTVRIPQIRYRHWKRITYLKRLIKLETASMSGNGISSKTRQGYSEAASLDLAIKLV